MSKSFQGPPRPPRASPAAAAAAASKSVDKKVTPAETWEEELFNAVGSLGVIDNNFAEITRIADGIRKDGLGHLLTKSEWKDNWSPLHAAVMNGHVGNMSILVKTVGCDVNAVADFGPNARFTALHWAAFYDKEESVRTLLHLGADPELKGKLMSRYSGTPLEWATKKKSATIVKILHETKKTKEAPKVKEDDNDGDLVNVGVLVSRVTNKRKLEGDLEKGLKIHRSLIAEEAKLKQMDREKERIDQETKKILANVTALKGDPDFLGLDKIKRIRQDLEDVKKLKRAFEKSEDADPEARSGGPESFDPDKSCPICFYPPKMVFGCQVCRNYICGDCWNKEEKIDRCPSCRADFADKPPIRNYLAEKLLGEN